MLSASERKAALIKRGVSLTEIAHRCGCTTSLVSYVVRGRGMAGPKSLAVMREVARVLGEPVGWVFPGVEIPEKQMA